MLGAIPQGSKTLGPAGGTWQTYVLASDVTNSTLTFSDVTGLAWMAEPQAIYVYMAFIRFQSAATTTGINFCINTPATPNYVVNAFTHCGNTTTNGFGSFSRADDTGASAAGSTGVDAINSDVPLFFHGNVSNGTTAGLMQLRVHSEINTSQVTVKAGSTLLVMRVA